VVALDLNEAFMLWFWYGLLMFLLGALIMKLKSSLDERRRP